MRIVRGFILDKISNTPSHRLYYNLHIFNNEMYKSIINQVSKLQSKQVPATGIGLFRVLYGLVTLQEILFLLYFNHLIFDPIPYIDVEFPMIPFFLCAWGVIA